MKELQMAVEGRSCSHCVGAVRRVLEAQPGVEVLSVQIGSAHLAYDPPWASPAGIAEALEEAGYQAMLLEGAG